MRDKEAKGEREGEEDVKRGESLKESQKKRVKEKGNPFQRQRRGKGERDGFGSTSSLLARRSGLWRGRSYPLKKRDKDSLVSRESERRRRFVIPFLRGKRQRNMGVWPGDAR